MRRPSGIIGLANASDPEWMSGVYDCGGSVTDPTDASLVEQCLEGSKEAFAELVRRHQDRVYRLALRMTGDRDEAVDLAQETFIRAYRKLRLFDLQRSFGNWLLSLCANLGKNRFRSEARRRRAQDGHLELLAAGAPRPDPRKSALEEALRQMVEKLRIPLVLKHVEGLSYEEIAQVLGIGLSAAKMRVKRARDELVRILGPHVRGEIE
jgi:RNA polymerase sigma-70 factor (ECF subfamily)